MIIWSNVPDELSVQPARYQLPFLSKLQSQQPRVRMREGGYQFWSGPAHNDIQTQTPQGSQPALDIFTSQCELPLLQTEPSQRLQKYGYGYVGFYSFNWGEIFSV